MLRLMEVDKDPYVRGWCIQLALEDGRPDDALLRQLPQQARWDPSPVVRLYLTSALQRLPLAQRWAVAEELAANPDNAADQNLPLMIWYGIEPGIPTDPQRALALLVRAKVPLVREYVARRLATTPRRPPAEADATPPTEPAKSAKPAVPTLANPAKAEKRK
jgi:hypothetical protein